MPRFSVIDFRDSLPEIVVSHVSISKRISLAVKAGLLRKIASRLYTRNLTESPEALVRRNLWSIVAGYFPGGLVADRTALENAPSRDGSVCLISERGATVRLPGMTLRPRRGTAPLPSDRPFIGDLYISSPARAYLENMRPTRARGGTDRRTLTRREIEERLEALMRFSGADEISRLQDEIRTIAPSLELTEAASDLASLIGALLGTREARLVAPAARARQRGQPYDPARLELFHVLHAALRNHPPVTRLEARMSAAEQRTLAFYDAYFSNFIEGIEFAVEEAADIVFQGKIPIERAADAHDVLGTWRIVSDSSALQQAPMEANDFIEMLKHRHAIVMAGRPELNPGAFKLLANRAGSTVFVSPELVSGTLEMGLELRRSLERPFDRAVFVHFLIAEVHPFADGNGRMARVAMNGELMAAGEARIVTPTAMRDSHISALKALSLNGRPEALIRVLDYLQRWTAAINWRSINAAKRALTDCNAFLDPDAPGHEGVGLRMPEPTA